MRISGRNLNRVKTAIAHRCAILGKSIGDDSPSVKLKNEENPFGEDVKMVSRHKLNLKLLTTAEKDEVATKYESGMTMTAISDECGCHYATVGRILKTKGVQIRKR